MKPASKQCFRFRGAGWHVQTDVKRSPRVSAHGSLRIRHRAGTAMATDSPDGSLGGLILPRGMTIDRGHRLFLLAGSGQVLAFDGTQEEAPFVPILTLPVVDAGPFHAGASARSVAEADANDDFFRPDLRNWSSLVIANDHLFVWHHGMQRLLAYDLAKDTDPVEIGLGDQEVFDLAARGSDVWILSGTGDRSRQVLWLDARRLSRPSLTPIRLRGRASEAISDWSRIAVDRVGRLVLARVGSDSDDGKLWVFTDGGLYEDRVDEPEALRKHFEGPWIRCDEDRQFRVPEFLWRPFHRQPDEGKFPLYPDDPHAFDGRDAVALTNALFDMDGKSRPYEPRPRTKPLYESDGEWVSKALDSGIYRCSWGRIEIRIRNMPQGARVRILTHTSGQKPLLPDSGSKLWQDSLSFTRSDVEREDGTAGGSRIDALVGGRERPVGRYLTIRVQIEGDGFRTAAIDEMTVTFPHDSYSQYLPAIYRAERESRVLLERFLSIPQTEWESLEDRVEQLADTFDPDLVEEGAPLQFLSSWIGAPVDASASGTVQRRLLKATIKTLGRRGTPMAIREMIGALIRPEVADEPGPSLPSEVDWLTESVPAVVEGFEDRDFVVLEASGSHRLGSESVLAAGTPDNGLRVGVTAKLGEARLIPGSSPEDQLFRRHAHRFDVFVPEAWIRETEVRRRVESFLDRERPAHVAGRLRAVRPGVRIGVQSRIGVDSLIGEIPETRLESGSELQRGDGPWLGCDTYVATTLRYPEIFPAVRLGAGQ